MTPTAEMIDAGWKAGLGLNKLQVERILVAALAVARRPAVTDAMVNAADSVLSRRRPGIPDETIRMAIAAALSAQAACVEWQKMGSAPKDGTMLRLLVNPDKEAFTAFDDSLTPFETIGFNNLGNTEEDRWEFAGWDWSQDCFITGRGEVIGWAQMLEPSP